jgi:hypothetical protein
MPYEHRRLQATTVDFREIPCNWRLPTRGLGSEPSMDLLPREREQRALLEGLSRIIEANGFETFVAAPLLEPDPRFFPEPWEPSARGVRALALRLLRHAGLEGEDAFVTLFGESPTRGSHARAVAWFRGMRGATCMFGVHCGQLREHDAIVGTLCHEVAHAYRAVRGLAEAHDRLEEENTDLTTVYLGFGLLTTNNAYRFRKQARGGSPYAGTEWSTAWTGYLSPQAMAFALAAQVTARGLSAAEAKRIERLLETNQQAFFQAARRRLEKDIVGLRLRLGLPPVETWPEPHSPTFGKLPEDARFDPNDGAPVVWEEPRNEGRNVFRVRETMGARYALGGIFLGAIAGGVASAIFELGPAGAIFGGAALSAFALGWWGRARFTDACSDPECGAPLPADADTCPRCGGRIRGTIDDPNDRLAAEDALDRDA